MRLLALDRPALRLTTLTAWACGALLACVDASAPPPGPLDTAGPQCTPTIVCADRADCDPAHRCNLALDPPRCQHIYCGEDGAPCDDDVLCGLGLVCRATDDGGRCGVPSDAGDGCAADGDCELGLSCSPLTAPPTCQPQGGLGGACGNTPDASAFIACPAGLACSTLYDPPTCQPHPAPAGVRCDDASGLVCAARDACETSADAPATCAPRGGLGQPCAGEDGCLGDAVCLGPLDAPVCGVFRSTPAGGACHSDVGCVLGTWCNTGLAQPVCQGVGAAGVDGPCGRDLHCPFDQRCAELADGARRCVGSYDQAAGGPCDVDQVCTPPLHCGAGVCTLGVGQGAVCADDADCAAGLACGATGACEPGPAQGARCSVGMRCGAGLGCVQGWCAPAVAVGEPCTDPDGQATVFAACVEGAVCGYLTGGYKCVAVGGGQGVPCGWSWDTCRTGLRCSSNTCAPALDLGASCEASTNACRSGTRCNGSTCVAPSTSASDPCYQDNDCDAGFTCASTSSYSAGACKRAHHDSGYRCRDADQCAPTSRCLGLFEGWETGRCVKAVGPGGECADPAACEVGLACDLSAGRCVDPVGLGGSCGSTACSPGLACNRSGAPTCLAATLGVPCHGADEECVGEQVCRYDAFAVRRCQAVGAVLDPCEDMDDCEDGLRCVKAGAVPFIGAGRCRELGGLGADCAVVADCESGYACAPAAAGGGSKCQRPGWVTPI